MELHFCSQCGISIPLAEVQSGAAAAGEGRLACAEHRAAKATPPAAAAPKAGAGGDFQLLFCANCKVSVPEGDVAGGRAKSEFGSLLCAACTVGDTAERERRRKAVEAEMAADAEPSPADTANLRKCAVCSAAVPQGAIASGRALVEGNRVVCPRCRDAVPAARPAPAPSSGAGVPILLGLLVVACLAAGFFGWEYVQRSRQAPAAPPAASRDLDRLRTDTDARIASLTKALEALQAEKAAAGQGPSAAAQARMTGDLVAVREDLSEVRSRLMATDGDLAQRIAKLEGQVGGLQEMLKGLAARPAAEPPRGPTAGPEVRPPEGPAPEGPKPPVQPPVPQVNPEVTRLVKDLLESKDEGVRFAAANELTRRKEKAAIPAFARQLLEDANLIVRRACARGLGETKAWFGVPPLVKALEDKEAYVAQQANFALQAITGQDFGVTIDTSTRDRKSKAGAAAKWWDKNKDTPPDGVCLEPADLPK